MWLHCREYMIDRPQTRETFFPSVSVEWHESQINFLLRFSEIIKVVRWENYWRKHIYIEGIKNIVDVRLFSRFRTWHKGNFNLSFIFSVIFSLSTTLLGANVREWKQLERNRNEEKKNIEVVVSLESLRNICSFVLMVLLAAVVCLRSWCGAVVIDHKQH